MDIGYPYNFTILNIVLFHCIYQAAGKSSLHFLPNGVQAAF